MSEQKRAYLFQGPGLLRDEGIVASFKVQGFEVHRPFVLPAQMASLDLKLSRHDVLVFRGPWEPFPEEVLYARQLASKMTEIGKIINTLLAKDRPTVIAVGRWALALLLARWTSLGVVEVSNLHWDDLPADQRGPWIETKLGASTEIHYALLQGHAIPGLSGANFETRLATCAGHPLGWCFDGFLNLFFVDPFSFREGSQLDGFGYENQENLSNSAVFLGNMLAMRDA
ncbi:MAG: hypothetical protein ABIR96_10090 [Bdellovibrionota bacterium]